MKFLPGALYSLLAAVLLVAGCASVRETKFYTLSVPSEVRGREADRGYAATPIFIRVMPVTVPERLARPQLVVRMKGQESQLLILEQARWSSHFDQELRDALAAAIADKIGAINEIRGSRAPDQPVYRIAIELSQFDATLDSGVNARFDWTITHAAQAYSVACSLGISEAAGAGIESLVKGIQHVVATAAERISENLVALNEGGAATCRHEEK